ncbi:hypothetical protein BD408DRAFT_433720 [Parasitella parasitica]|nr:hypothetical protein BD408DRAFT_433720 [Parasitella parasitica]
MKESKLANLAFHQKVRHLVLDFASFDTIPSKSAKSTQNSDGIPTALSEMTDLIELCTQIEKLDIVFDADFKKLVSCTSIASYNAEDADSISMKNCILDSCNFLQQALIQQHGNDRVRRLDFIGIDPTRRCPCCMGAKWDQYLFPLLTCLVKVETLVLHNVVPSVDAFEALGSPNLTKIVFYKSVVTISAIKEGTSPRGKSSTSFDRIPPKLWKQIKHIEIYEDIEEATTWQITKYLTKLVNNVHDLESFVLQFDTKEANEKCLSLTQGSNINSIPVKDTLDSGHRIANTSSPLYHLQMKCKNTLNMITLVNVPSDM